MDIERVEAFMKRVEQSEQETFAPVGQKLKVGVDLGTAYIVLVVLDEENNPVACEKQAADVLRDGVVVDYLGALRIVKELKAKLEKRIGRELVNCAIAMPAGTESSTKTHQYVAEGAGFEEVCTALREQSEAGHILFALASFDNLAKNGRVSKVVGFIAGRLNMRVLGKRTPDGKIDFFYKTRGEARVLARILEQMDRDGYDGRLPVQIAHCDNENAAAMLTHGIRAKWPQAEIFVHPCGGLCSFYAQDQGIILTY